MPGEPLHGEPQAAVSVAFQMLPGDVAAELRHHHRADCRIAEAEEERSFPVRQALGLQPS